MRLNNHIICMKINVVGWYHNKNGNIGDEAFRYAFHYILANHTFTFITPPAICPPADLTILGGGAVVSPFYLNILPKNQPKYALGVGLAYESEVDLLAAANFQGIFVRNQSDVKKMQEKAHCPVQYVPDLAYLLSPEPVKFTFSNRPRLGVLITDYINPALDRPIDKFAARSWDFKLKLAGILDELSKEGWEIWLIPCSTGGYGNDNRINLDIAAFMTQKPICIMDALTPGQMIKLLSCMDINLCMRFHAHIFSIMARRPFASIDFTRKVNFLLKENNLESLRVGWFEKDAFECSKLGSLIRQKEQLHQHYSPVFDAISQKNKAELEKVIAQVRRDWLRESF